MRDIDKPKSFLIEIHNNKYYIQARNTIDALRQGIDHLDYFMEEDERLNSEMEYEYEHEIKIKVKRLYRFPKYCHPEWFSKTFKKLIHTDKNGYCYIKTN